MALKDWKKDKSNKWKNKYDEIVCVQKLSGSHYVRIYNRNGFLLDSLIYGSKDKAIINAKAYMKKHSRG